MTKKSTRTFSEERERLQGIPGIFWQSPYEYPLPPFEGVEGVLFEGKSEYQYQWRNAPDFDLEAKAPRPRVRGARQLPGTGFWLLDRPGARRKFRAWPATRRRRI